MRSSVGGKAFQCYPELGKGSVPFYSYLDSLLNIGFSGISKALRISVIF